MLKIGKYEIINDGLIESFCIYEGKPLSKLVKNASEKNSLRRITGRYGFKTFIMMRDGYIYLCPFLPDTYLKKIDSNDYLIIDSKRYFIKKEFVREITSKPNAKQSKEIKQAKLDKMYVNLTKHRVTRYHIFTTTGRIYGVHALEKQGLV